MACDVPPLKTTVNDMAELRLPVKHVDAKVAQGRRAACAIDSAQIEIRQTSFKQPGNFATNTVTIKQNCITVQVT